MTERMRFIGRLIGGEKMTDLCREFGISRVTGHKIWARFKAEGSSSFVDRSSRPWKLANRTPAKIESMILQLKDKHQSWGAPKLLSHLARRHRDVRWPAKSTVHAILDRHGLVKHKSGRKKYRAQGTELRSTAAPNELWCADFKGQFKTQNGKYCYPLTISDHYSRYLLACEALESVREVGAIDCFKSIFKEHGLPDAIRTDNGSPFSCRTLFGLSRLSVLWLRLGIRIERIMPGHPEQNGRHERMHRTLKQDTAVPASQNLLQQQERFDAFRQIFNHERPHEALKMQSPSDIYVASRRCYPRVLDEYDYSSCDLTRRVCRSGSIKIGQKKVFISEVFAYQDVGINREDDAIWAVNFMGFRLGYFGNDSSQFSPGPNPFMKLEQ